MLWLTIVWLMISSWYSINWLMVEPRDHFLVVVDIGYGYWIRHIQGWKVVSYFLLLIINLHFQRFNKSPCLEIIWVPFFNITALSNYIQILLSTCFQFHWDAWAEDHSSYWKSCRNHNCKQHSCKKTGTQQTRNRAKMLSSPTGSLVPSTECPPPA